MLYSSSRVSPQSLFELVPSANTSLLTQLHLHPRHLELPRPYALSSLPPSPPSPKLANLLFTPQNAAPPSPAQLEQSAKLGSDPLPPAETGTSTAALSTIFKGPRARCFSPLAKWT